MPAFDVGFKSSQSAVEDGGREQGRKEGSGAAATDFPTAASSSSNACACVRPCPVPFSLESIRSKMDLLLLPSMSNLGKGSANYIIGICFCYCVSWPNWEVHGIS